MRATTITMLALLCSGTAVANEPLLFSNQALQRGLDFYITNNFTQHGAGLLLADLDADGDLDIMIAGGTGGKIGVYENDGTGYFTERTDTSGITPIAVASGITAADYDNDTDLDIFVSSHFGQPRLYRNNGDWTFTDVAADLGIMGDEPQYAASWSDVDLNGHLDLYVSVRTGDSAFTGGNHLYLNGGDGTFRDKAITHNVDAEGDPTLLSTFFDFDRDGDDDLYLGTDKGSGGTLMNRLYRNDGGVFTEITTQANAMGYVDCMGIAVGDLNFDGFFDLYLTNTPPGNKLLMHDGVDAYVDMTVPAGVGSYRVGWGAVFADFDNDTQLDLFVCNMMGADRLYRGSPNWPLVDEAPAAGVDEMNNVFSVAEGDVDGDGDLDLLVSNAEGNIHLYINNSPDLANNNWVRFNVVGNRGPLNQYAVGTCVDLTHQGKTQVRQVRSGTNYKSQSEYTLHFGVADADRIDSARIIFPGGDETRTLKRIPSNRVWTLYPQSMLGDPNGNGRIDYFELYEAIISRTGPGNPIEPGLEIYDMDGDFDIDNDDLALMDLRIRTPKPKNLGVNVGP